MRTKLYLTLFLGFCLLFVLCLVAFKASWRGIEIDIQQRVNQALAQNSLNWFHASTHNRGRDVLLIGTPVSKTQATRALEVVNSVDGVRILETQFSEPSVSLTDGQAVKFANQLQKSVYQDQDLEQLKNLVKSHNSSKCYALDAELLSTNLYYDSPQSLSKQNGFSGIRHWLGAAKLCSEFGIRIAIHTDDSFSSTKSLEVSESIGTNILNYFRGKGISSTRVELHSLGKSSPTSNNKTALGRARNRRIELTLIKKEL